MILFFTTVEYTPIIGIRNPNMTPTKFAVLSCLTLKLYIQKKATAYMRYKELKKIVI